VKKYFGILKQTVKEFSEDKVPRLGAALAYYTIFSIAPLLLISIAIAGLAFGEEAAQGKIFKQLDNVLGATTAKGVQDLVKAASKPKTGAIATIAGIFTLILGASGVFGQLKDALNTIWDVKTKKTKGIWGFVKDRFLSAAMVFGIGFLLLVALIIDAAISAVIPEMQIVQMLISLAVVTVLFAAIFRILPDLKIQWHDVWLGAAFTSVLFVLGKFALGMYLGRSAVGSTYGAAGSLVVLLLWVYYSAQILLFGAEFTQVYARTTGSLRDQSKTTEKEREDLAHGEEPKPLPPVPAPEPQRGGRALPVAGGIAAGGCAGLLIGAIAGIAAGVVTVVKSVKKLFP
jgi:membrane protein